MHDIIGFSADGLLAVSNVSDLVEGLPATRSAYK